MITLRDRVIGFFLRCPGEELTRADMMERWSIDRSSAWASLRTLQHDGLLQAHCKAPKSRSRELTYTPTPALLALGDAA